MQGFRYEGEYMIVRCPSCREQFDVNPRPSNWRGGILTHFYCPKCNYGMRHQDVPQGVYSTRSSVFIDFPDRPSASIQEYECSEAHAQRFAKQFSRAWSRIPTAARQLLIADWSDDPHAPYVWLLNDRTVWNGKGWAAAKGIQSLFFVAAVVVEIPEQHIQLFVAHEIAHMLFISAGEEQHSIQPRTLDIVYKCERLVWDAMKAWGFDQIAAEEWMERNFEDTSEGLQRRPTPLDVADHELSCLADRTRIESTLNGFPFPPALEKYMRD